MKYPGVAKRLHALLQGTIDPENEVDRQHVWHQNLKNEIKFMLIFGPFCFTSVFVSAEKRRLIGEDSIPFNPFKIRNKPVMVVGGQF